MNFKKYKQELDKKRNTVQMKTNDRMSYCESQCSRLQNKNAVSHHLINKSCDNNIEICNDLNVVHEEEVETSETISYESDKYIDKQAYLQQAASDTSKLVVSDEICYEIELRTRGQSDNKLWFEARKGRLTASLFHDVLKRKERTNPHKLAKRIIGEKRETVNTVTTEWGIKHTHHEHIAMKLHKPICAYITNRKYLS